MIRATLLRYEIVGPETNSMRCLRCAAVSVLFASSVLASAQGLWCKFLDGRGSSGDVVSD